MYARSDSTRRYQHWRPLGTRPSMRTIAFAASIAALVLWANVHAPAADAGLPAHVAGDAASTRQARNAATEMPVLTPAALAAALQDTTAGSEQIFCAADLPQARRLHARHSAPSSAQLQARVRDRS